MKIRTKLLLLLLAVSVIPITLTAVVTARLGQNSLEGEVFRKISAINTVKVADFIRWMNTNAQYIEHYSLRSVFRDNIDQLVAENNNPKQHVEFKTQFLEEHIEPALVEQYSLLKIHIIRVSDGKIILSTSSKDEGKFRENEKQFLEGQKGLYISPVSYLLQEGTISLTISAPIYNNSDDIVAVLVGELDFAHIAEILAAKGVLRSTEDSYLVNSFNFFVTPPQHLADAALKRAVYTDIVNSCLSGVSGLDIYKDYTDSLVYGSYTWIDEYGLCMFTEVSADEVREPLSKMSMAIMGFDALLIIFVTIGGSYFARSISNPVGQLADGALEIGRGNLTHRITFTGRDEFGNLAAVFNQMTENLLDSQRENRSLIEQLELWNSELEMRVEERTRDLKDAQLATMSIMEDVDDARRKAEEATAFLQREKLFTDRVINSIPDSTAVTQAKQKR